MNNKKLKIVIFIFTVLCIIATAFNLLYNFLVPIYLSLKFNTDFSDANTIGIIGGADGPTTIFVSNSNSPYLTAILALLSIVGIAYLVISKRKKAKKDKDIKAN